MGGGSETIHHTTETPNDYDDAWIRSKFDAIDERGRQYSTWQAGREAALSYEQRQRQANADALSGLTGDFRALGATVEGLGRGQDRLGADFRGLGATQTRQFEGLSAAQRQAAMEQNEQFQNMTAQQQQQFKDIYNLQGQGSVEGVRTQRGITPGQRRGGGAYGSMNRGGMRINQSLNV